ncbi:hypothetical protein VCEDC022_003331B, partial [Vibrio cholerae O1 str. EDC-022]
KNDHKIP